MNQNVVILLAEDNLGHAKLTKKHLKRSGISNTIIHFNNGAELLNYLHNNSLSSEHPEEGLRYIAIMDLKMPVMDGYRTLKEMKQNDFLSVIPVIMYSTSDDPKEIYDCYHYGCNGYIVKPVIAEDFASFIKNLVGYLKIIQVPIIKNNKPVKLC